MYNRNDINISIEMEEKKLLFLRIRARELPLRQPHTIGEKSRGHKCNACDVPHFCPNRLPRNDYAVQLPRVICRQHNSRNYTSSYDIPDD
jgi:hypothetical protein